ncbi:MAG: sulfite exporter TauE/SafE family protein [Thermoplasmata archaeon]
MDLILLLAALVILGAGAGLVGSLAGLGGGLVIVPLLVVVFQVPLVDAIGASAVSVLATSATTGAAYVEDRLTDVRIGMFLEIATVPGALLGVIATLALARLGLASALLVLLGIILLATLPGSWRRRDARDLPPPPPDARSRRLGLRGIYHDPRLGRDIEYQAGRTTPALATMFGAGIVSGMFGIGSGVLKVLALERFLGLPLKVATATSNFMIGVTVAASAGVLLLAGDVNPVLIAPVALGTVAGSYLGSRILPGLSSTILRLIFLGVVAVLAAELIARGVGLG